MLKNDPTRFLGEGVSFKAKLIGILEVSEARGDRMCQAALADLKMAIRAAGEHKQRIAVQVSIDGLRLRDEKTGDCLYHHPVHKISFIAQDMSDSRAFGYIFGSPDTGHRFFGIKTDKAASQVVIAMRDLFQVVFELKKKEIELAKQHIEQNAINAIKFHTGGIFVEPAPDTKGAAGTESSFHRIRTNNCEADKPADRKNESQSGVIADLLDLQFELNSLQQGIHQMDKITPENPVPSTDDLFESDPFGDSFANMKLQDTVRPILPPPPSSTKRGHLERQHTVPVPPVSTTSSPATTLVSKTPPPQSTIHWFDKEAENLFNDSELTNLNKNSTPKKDQEDSSTETTPRNTQTKSPQIDVFTELDPLGTGLIKPYVDKKDFFQHLKNPPKKVLKDLVSTNSSDSFPTNFNTTTESLESTKTQNELSSRDSEDSNFANFDRFDENEANQSASQQRIDSPPKKETAARSIHHQPLSVSLPPEETTSKGTITSTTASGGTSSILRSMDRDSTESTQALVKLPSPKKYLQSVRKRDFDIDLPAGKTQSVESSKPFPVDFSVTNESPASPLRSCSSDANSRLSSSSAELDLVPEPPPRGAGSILINPPPLPPKKQGVRGGTRPPPRPPHTDGHFQYDFPQREASSPSPTRIVRDKNKSPPRDAKGHQFDDNFSPPPQTPARSDFTATTTTTSAFEDSFSTMIPSTTSQLTSSWTNLDELASSLGMTVQQLTSLTLTQLTQCLASLSTKEIVADDAVEETVDPSMATMKEQPVVPPKPAISSLSSLAELLEMEQGEQKEETKVEEIAEMEEASNENGQVDGEEIQPEVRTSESTSDSITSLASLTVKLSSRKQKDKLVETEDRDVEKESEQTEIDVEDDTEKTQTIMEAEEKVDNSEKGSDANGTLSDKVGSDILNEETNGSSVADRSSTEVKSSASTSSDRTSPMMQSQQPKSLAEIELLNLFSDNLPPPSSPNISAKKDSIDLKAVAMDIFEEIKMLNTDMHRVKDTKPAPSSSSGFEDMFCPFSETTRSDKDDGKEDGNWAKFDTGIFDGKDFHREVPFKGSGGYRHSGDSDNEWKDEEESEESNGRGRGGDGRFWSGSRHPRFDAPGFEDRSSFYEDGEKRDRSFRERMGRKSRGAPWTKNSGGHRPRDPSPWHEEGQWEDEGPRRYPHRKMQPYKDDEDHQESMGYDEEDRWSRRRERPHDYPSWDEEYASERPSDESPRYNPAGRKRHWPKRPNSANDGRNSDMLSRESYWGSDQEYDSWVERPYWSEGPDSKSETMHRKRIARHKTRQTQKTQSPFEDDFAQSVEHVEPSSGTGSGAAESLAPMDARVRLEMTEQKRELPPPATPEELPCDAGKDPPPPSQQQQQQQPVDGFVSEDSGRDSFFNGDLRFDDDAFVFKSELDDNVPDHRATTGDQYIRKSESVNIFARESDPFDGDDFFN
ncbi:protein disabled [Lasius niger]|uniref:Protein disabled n=1 Tax=Lasius niger TaxID=67767 RepID=A0A0J7P0E8_LASNI|nr:protein disabled [Lasius niger]